MTLTVQSLAERWACSADQVLALIRQRELKAFDVAIRHSKKRHKPRWRIPLAEVEAFELRRTVGPKPTVERKRKEEIPQYV